LPDSAILMGRFRPRNRCRQTDKSGVPLDLTQSPGWLHFPFCFVIRAWTVSLILGTRRFGQVRGKVLIRFFALRLLIAFGH
jgi:hypothetical protein